MKKERVEKREERQILVFRVGNEEWGLDISCVHEVLGPQEVYSLPKTPDFIEGVINLRGHIIPLIDLGKRLHARQLEDKPNKRIIICRVNQSILGLTVDGLKEMIALSKEEIQGIPEVVSRQMESDVLSGIAMFGERVIAILNLDHVVTKKEINELSSMDR